MRIIKFRGKRIDNNEWVYGFLYQLELLPYGGLGTMILTDDDNCESDVISPFNLAFRKGVDLFMVDKDTVGQFTGLHDKNGKEIYEGDIIKIVEKFDDENVYTSNGVVCFEEGIYEVQNGKHFAYLGWLMHNDDITKLEVIGNIHDDKNLLEEGGEQ